MEHSRCPAHGLIIVADGHCSRCLRNDERASTTRIYTMVAAVSVVVLMLLGGWRAVAMTTRASAAPRATSEEPTAGALPDPRTGHVVTVFTTSHCPWCTKAKTWLDDHQVAYTERRVDDDRAAAAEMHRVAGGGGVPTFVVDGQVHRGYSVPWLEKTFSSSR